MPEQTKSQQFRCPGCAADMEFDPVERLMKCRFCGQTLAQCPPAPTGVAAAAFSGRFSGENG